MTTDDLRAKFEAHFSQPPYSWRFRLNKAEDICGWPGAYDNYYIECAWKGWQAAHASRDAEVEALRKDAERYRWLRDRAVHFELDEGKRGTPYIVYGIGMGDSVPTCGSEADSMIDDCKVIDAAMREESK